MQYVMVEIGLKRSSHRLKKKVEDLVKIVAARILKSEISHIRQQILSSYHKRNVDVDEKDLYRPGIYGKDFLLVGIPFVDKYKYDKIRRKLKRLKKEVREFKKNKGILMNIIHYRTRCKIRSANRI